MLRPANSCPALADKQSPKGTGEASSVRTSDTQETGTKSKRKTKVQSDFPTPPKSLEIAFAFQSSPQHYHREGCHFDAAEAVVGTGAFGAAYRYVRAVADPSTGDASLSTMSTQTSGSDFRLNDPHRLSSDPSSVEEELLRDSVESATAKKQVARRVGLSPMTKLSFGNDIAQTGTQVKPPDQTEQEAPDVATGTERRQRSGSVLRTAASLPQLKQAAQQSVLQRSDSQNPSHTTTHLHDVVVIKLCRTPITGGFDELPRNPKNATVKPKPGWHVRIVRGEGRLLRYLQKAQALQIALERSKTTSPSVESFSTSASAAKRLSGQPSDETFVRHGVTSRPGGGGAPDVARPHGFAQASHVVRLLADLPANGSSDGQIFSPLPDSVGEESAAGYLAHDAVRAVQLLDDSSRPPYRMLAFEELVDLDAELVDGAWVPGTQPWTKDHVERAARETAMGLRFLHAHAIVHSDLKPANLMRCPKTGAVKIIDLGAARRFVRIEDQFKHSVSIVEERDAAMNSAEEEATILKDTYCDGLTSLTGSPHFMAPEILLQAARYIDKDGCSRSTLKDYKRQPHFLPPSPSTQWLRLCLDDYAVGWGLKADIWSWGCCVLSFLVRMLAPLKDRNNTALICPFDFTFDDISDALHPLHELAPSQTNMPHFHLWARIYPLRIQEIVSEGAHITPRAKECMSANLTRMVNAALRHRSLRPTAAQICDSLQPTHSRPPLRPSRHSVTGAGLSSESAASDAAQCRHSKMAGQHDGAVSVAGSVGTSQARDHQTSRASSPSKASELARAALKDNPQRVAALQKLNQESVTSEPKHHPPSAYERGRRQLRDDMHRRASYNASSTEVFGSKPPADAAALQEPEKKASEDGMGSAQQQPGCDSPESSARTELQRKSTALGLELGKVHFGTDFATSPERDSPLRSPTMSRIRGHLASLLASPPSPGDLKQQQRRLLTPPETPRDSTLKQKGASMRRRLSNVSGLNLRFGPAMQVTPPRDNRQHASGAGPRSPLYMPTGKASEGGPAASTSLGLDAEQVSLAPAFSDPEMPIPLAPSTVVSLPATTPRLDVSGHDHMAPLPPALTRHGASSASVHSDFAASGGGGGFGTNSLRSSTRIDPTLTPAASDMARSQSLTSSIPAQSKSRARRRSRAGDASESGGVAGMMMKEGVGAEHLLAAPTPRSRTFMTLDSIRRRASTLFNSSKAGVRRPPSVSSYGGTSEHTPGSPPVAGGSEARAQEPNESRAGRRNFPSYSTPSSETSPPQQQLLQPSPSVNFLTLRPGSSRTRSLARAFPFVGRGGHAGGTTPTAAMPVPSPPQPGFLRREGSSASTDMRFSSVFWGGGGAKRASDPKSSSPRRRSGTVHGTGPASIGTDRL